MNNLRLASVALALAAVGCLQPVQEEECDDARPCGSGWLCVKGVCAPPGNTGGGSATGGGTTTGGGSATGGGTTTGGGSATGGGISTGGGSATGGGISTGGGTGGGGVTPVGGGGQTGGGMGGGPGCPGCVDAMGQCEPGVTNAACGINGSGCSSCSGNTACFNGQCTMPQCPNCSGCCIGGICLGGTSSMACGSGGAQCVDCSNGGGFCQGGMCVGGAGGGGGAGACGPSNCMGCCDNNGLCRGGFTRNHCGAGGASCVQCQQGESCQMGVCSGGAVDAGMGLGLPVGSACTNQLDCQPPQTNICISELSSQFGQSGFPGGYCSALCANVMCPMGSSCIGHEFIGPNGGGVSLQLCLTQCPAPRMGQSSCRIGYVCEKDTSGMAAGVCTPRCDDPGDSCPMGQTCDPTSGYCN